MPIRNTPPTLVEVWAAATVHPSSALWTAAAINNGTANPCSRVSQSSCSCVCEHAGQTVYRNRSIVHSSAKPPPTTAAAPGQPRNSAISGSTQNSATPIKTPPPNGTIRRESDPIDSSQTPAVALRMATKVINRREETTTTPSIQCEIIYGYGNSGNVPKNLLQRLYQWLGSVDRRRAGHTGRCVSADKAAIHQNRRLGGSRG